jgi:hypothetical protein
MFAKDLMNHKIKKTRTKSPSPYPEADNNIQSKTGKISDLQTEYVSRVSRAPNLKSRAILPAVEQPPLKLKSVKLDSALSRNVADIEVPDDVLRFAEKHELLPYLETAILLVRECFSSVKKIQLAYEIDWEAENESWIAVNIQAPGKADKVLQQYLRFNQQMIQQIPPAKSDKILLGIGGLGN